MSNNLEYMREHNCKHLKNCSHASVVEYQYSDDKKERMNNMKKLFVSVPMKGRTEKEIKESIQKMKKIAEIYEGEELELIDSYIDRQMYLLVLGRRTIGMVALSKKKQLQSTELSAMRFRRNM